MEDTADTGKLRDDLHNVAVRFSVVYDYGERQPLCHFHLLSESIRLQGLIGLGIVVVKPDLTKSDEFFLSRKEHRLDFGKSLVNVLFLLCIRGVKSRGGVHSGETKRHFQCFP